MGLKESNKYEACFFCLFFLGVGGRDTGYFPFYFQGYWILSILLPGIWDTMLNFLVTFRDIEYLGKIIMGIFASL